MARVSKNIEGVLIGLCYALGLKLKKWTIMKSNESQKQIVVL